MAFQYGPKIAPVTRAVTKADMRAVTPYNTVTDAVTRKEFDELRALVAALKTVVEGFGAKNRAAYMREYRKRPKP